MAQFFFHLSCIGLILTIFSYGLAYLPLLFRKTIKLKDL